MAGKKPESNRGLMAVRRRRISEPGHDPRPSALSVSQRSTRAEIEPLSSPEQNEVCVVKIGSAVNNIHLRATLGKIPILYYFTG